MKYFGMYQRKNRKQFYRHQNAGFTMIEVVVAAMLLTMVLLAAFPLFQTGKAIVDQKQRKQEIELLGDYVFEGAAKELQNAEMNDFESEEAEDGLDERLYLDGLDNLEEKLDPYGLDLEILAEPLESGWFFLLVELSEEGTVQYHREEMILSPNYGLWQKSNL